MALKYLPYLFCVSILSCASDAKEKLPLKSDQSTTMDSASPAAGNWNLVRRIESDHPYANDVTQSWEVVGSAGVTEMKVVFERFDLENGYDVLTVRSQNGEETSHTGNRTDQEHVIVGGSMQLEFVSDYSITKFGFVIDVFERVPCLCPTVWAPACGVDGQTYGNSCEAGCAGVAVAYLGECRDREWHTVQRLVESPHPYSNNYDNTFTISEGGAHFIRVHFAKVAVERGYDHLYLLDGDDQVVAEYTGEQIDFSSPTVAGDTIKIRLKTDYSVTDYGFVVDSYDVTGGCRSDAECGPNMRCVQVECIRAPCFPICEPVGPAYTDVTLAELEADPDSYVGQLVRLVATPQTGLAACTKIYCPAEDPCCNTCSAFFSIGGVALFDANDVRYNCTGDECTWNQSCEPFAAANGGPYTLSGLFSRDQDLLKLQVHTYSAAACQKSGCSGQLCTNGPRASTCEWRPEYACYRSAICEAQPLDGHCGWTKTPELLVCLENASLSRFEATDVPLQIPDNDAGGITSSIEAFGAAQVALLHLSLNITHTYRGDLTVTLIAPDGTSHVLHDGQGGSRDDLIIEDLELPQFQGVQVPGIWRLRVVDNARYDEGTLNGWSITVR